MYQKYQTSKYYFIGFTAKEPITVKNVEILKLELRKHLPYPDKLVTLVIHNQRLYLRVDKRDNLPNPIEEYPYL